MATHRRQGIAFHVLVLPALLPRKKRCLLLVEPTLLWLGRLSRTENLVQRGGELHISEPLH